jgi:hypothetical protein
MPFFSSEGGRTCQPRTVFTAEQEMSTNGRSDRSAEGRTRTGTQVTLRGILSPLLLFKSKYTFPNFTNITQKLLKTVETRVLVLKVQFSYHFSKFIFTNNALNRGSERILSSLGSTFRNTSSRDRSSKAF